MFKTLLLLAIVSIAYSDLPTIPDELSENDEWMHFSKFQSLYNKEYHNFKEFEYLMDSVNQDFEKFSVILFCL